jgi:hypothetical protein
VGHPLRSSSLIHLEASRARVSQFNLKTSGGTTWMVHVTSLRRSCAGEAEDGRVNAIGYISLFYLNFAIFIVLGHRDILVFYLGL